MRQSSLVTLAEKYLQCLNDVLSRLRKYEKKYGMPTEKFIKKWKSGKIPEPENHDTLVDFMNWEEDYELFLEITRKLRDIIKNQGED